MNVVGRNSRMYVCTYVCPLGSFTRFHNCNKIWINAYNTAIEAVQVATQNFNIKLEF